MNEQEQRGYDGFELHKYIEKNELKRRRLLLENIECLEKIYKDKLYKEILGDDSAEWSAYLSQIEVYYTRAKIRKLLKISEKFKMQLDKIIDIPISRLMDITSLENVDYDEWFDKARVLTPRDWRIEIRHAKGLVTADTCEHQMVPYEICGICGEKHRK